MPGPYFITTLEVDVRIHPSQMDNNIMDNIKRNLDRTYSNKCYNNYGYIDRIIDIDDDVKGGVIRAEDNTASSIHRVNFRCRICNPIKKSIIMGKIVGINNMIIVAENGPIRFIIGESDINRDNIQFKKSAYYPVIAKGEILNKPINKGSYIMIQVMNKKIVKGKTKIIVFGRLESAVLDDNVMDTIRNQYESNEEVGAANLLNEQFFNKSTNMNNIDNEITLNEDDADDNLESEES